jgi:Polysaccharide deacetylase
VWWIALEAAIAKAPSIKVPVGGTVTLFDTSTPSARQATFDRLHDWLRSLPGEYHTEREISALCARHGVDEAAIPRELCLSWDELKKFADDPLVTIGAHTITHCNLARQSEATASFEMATSRARIEEALQRPVLHFAYPYGDEIAAGPARLRASSARIRAPVSPRPQDDLTGFGTHGGPLQRPFRGHATPLGLGGGHWITPAPCQ